ncbi:facilitated trehalose transporter Tret1-like [Harmonia axyridis]|uniref:facilitated trehalose transporter Tret1-like n=1 Tax=Harmonia axyridis TaxID=115357 RepID=UPI001E27573F|nr:facilitated trehalose transporter Tret1-like [Harmonia axyridis]
MNLNLNKIISSIRLWEFLPKIIGRRYIFLVIFVVNISSLINGMSFAWSSPTLVKLKETNDNLLGNPITPDQSDLIGSLFYIGAAIGPLLVIWSLETLGRRPTLIVLGLPLTLSYILLAVAKSIEIYYLCRVVLGIIVGGIVCVGPVYSSEILPVNLRGSLMSLSNSFIQGGSLLAYVIGPYMPIAMFNLTIAILSMIFVVLFVLICPESPYFIMLAKGKEESKNVLEIVRQDNVTDELNSIETSIKNEEKRSYLRIFETRHNIKCFILATTVLIIQQVTGINIVIGYSQLIFLESKIDFSSEKCSIIVGCLQVISSFIAPILSDRFPRKKMLCFSLFTMCLCNFIICSYFFFLKDLHLVSWLPLLTLAFFVVLDNCGDGPLPWVLLGELYPSEIRSVGPALSTTIYYIAQFILTFLFNKVELKFMFFVYAWCCLFGTAFIHYFIPETSGKTLNDIQEALRR